MRIAKDVSQAFTEADGEERSKMAANAANAIERAMRKYDPNGGQGSAFIIEIDEPEVGK